jgi:basic membrane protein A
LSRFYSNSAVTKMQAVIILVVLIIAFGAGIYAYNSMTPTSTMTESSMTVPSTETSMMQSSTTAVYKVAMIVPGAHNDLSWNNAAVDGLMAVGKDLGIQVDYQDQVKPADAEAVLRLYAEKGYNMILAHSFDYGDAVNKTARDFPKVMFGWATGYTNFNLTNVATYDWPSHQAAYLAGYLAAAMTKSGIIATMGGFPIPDVDRGMWGFVYGAQAYNPKIKILADYVQAWDDPDMAKEHTIALLNQGADVIYNGGDGISKGTIEAANEWKASGKFVYIVGGIYDQSQLAPNITLTSVVFHPEANIKQMVQDAIAGTYKSSYLLDMTNGGVDLAPYHNLQSAIPEQVIASISSMRADIISGKLVIQNNETAVPAKIGF